MMTFIVNSCISNRDKAPEQVTGEPDVRDVIKFVIAQEAARKRTPEQAAKNLYSKAWKAKEFFDDPKVIALCQAIQAKNISKIDKLVADGVDVNAKGKGNMTPLLWSFPGNNLNVFKRLLEHGADPNVEITSDLNTDGAFAPGDSVLHMAARTEFPDYFKYVMQHGGDPNLIGNKENSFNSPLLAVIEGTSPNKKECVQLLIDAGADLDYLNTYTNRSALITADDCDLIVQLVEAGASFNICTDYGNTALHIILHKSEMAPENSKSKQDYEKLIQYLKGKGADIEGAKKDREKGKRPPERIAELKKIYADELEAKKKAKEAKP